MIRPYEKKDHAMLSEWWKAWKWVPVTELFLPDIGLVCDDKAAGFLYTTNSKISWVEWVVCDPKASKPERSEAINELIHGLCALAKEKGAKVVFTSTNKLTFEKRLLKLGFIPSDKDVTQLFRFLGE